MGGLDVLRRGDLGAPLIGLGLRQFRRFHGDRDLTGDFGHFEGATALHLDLAALTVAFDARLLERELERDLLAFGLLARTDLGLLDQRRRDDLAMFDLLLVLDTRFRKAPFLKESRLLNLFARDDLRLFALALTFGAILGQFDALRGAADFDVVLLGDARVFAVALDVERAALGFEILRPDLNLRALLDLVAHAPARFDGFRELGQALGVERVRTVEELETGLVKVDDRDAFEFEAVLREPLGGGGLHALGIVLSQFVQVFEAHLRGGGAERRGEPALEQLPRALGIERAPPKCLGGAAHLLAGRADTNEEVGDDVDAHPVLGDQALRSGGATPRSASHSCRPA